MAPAEPPPAFHKEHTDMEKDKEVESSDPHAAAVAAAAAPPPHQAQKAAQAIEMNGRMHSTVRLNQFTLRFEDATLESAYQASIHKRKKALWLRSLVPAAGSHLLFGLGDCIEHPVANLQVTLPARVFLAVLQISMFVLVNWVRFNTSPRDDHAARVSLQWDPQLAAVRASTPQPPPMGTKPSSCLFHVGHLYSLYTNVVDVFLPVSSLSLQDALFVIFGLSFYTIPKITPLGFISSTGGSWATAVLYIVLSFMVRPPTRPAESVLGLFYCVSVIGIFNTISYYSEYNSRERFVLRRRLSSESITLAVARTNTLVPPEGTDRFFKTLAHSNGPTFFFGVFLWGAFTTGGWASLPDTLKFVDEETGWAWFSHCAGMTVFLLVMTRQLMWLFVVPVLGSLILWMMSLTMPSEWIIISAHSVGYGLLVASVIVAMGVFSWFVCAWKELVSFLTRSCFLYPQLQAGLESEYPLLVKIVSEYTAGFDPEIISSRMPASKRIVGSVSEVRALRSGSEDHHWSSGQGTMLQSSTSPRRRAVRTVKAKLLVNSDAPHHRHENGMISEYANDAEFELSRPEELVRSELVSEHVDGKMVSVLPSFKAGKCFFCSKNDAEHFVPACGMWGKWTHWRMNQQQNGANGHNSGSSSSSSSSSSSLLAKPVVSMCTSYYDIQNQKSELELKVNRLEENNANLQKQIQQLQGVERETAAVNVHLKSEMRALDDKFAMDLQRHDAQWQQKMKALLEESNKIAHEHKLELKRSETARAGLRKQIEAMQRDAEKAEKRAQGEMEQQAKRQETVVDELQAQLASYKVELEALKSKLEPTATGVATASAAQLSSSFSSTTSAGSNNVVSPVANLQTLQPSKRLPYAQFLEIEGLRESSRKREGKTDYSESWRYALDSPDSFESY